VVGVRGPIGELVGIIGLLTRETGRRPELVVPALVDLVHLGHVIGELSLLGLWIEAADAVRAQRPHGADGITPDMIVLDVTLLVWCVVTARETRPKRCSLHAGRGLHACCLEDHRRRIAGDQFRYHFALRDGSRHLYHQRDLDTAIEEPGLGAHARDAMVGGDNERVLTLSQPIDSIEEATDV
jgi:hypothetical protein